MVCGGCFDGLLGRKGASELQRDRDPVSQRLPGAVPLAGAAPRAGSRSVSFQPAPQLCTMPGMVPQMSMRMPPQQHRSSFGCAPTAAPSSNDDEALDTSTASGSGAQPEAEPVASGEGTLQVITRVEYRAMPRDGSRAVFGLVTLQAAPAPITAERQPMDLVCVLDVSGSMGGHKIQQLQDSMRFVISQAQPQDRLAIVTFNSGAARPLGLRRMREEGKDAAQIAVVRLQAGGGTSISAGLDLGLQVMEQRRERNKVSAILLLTDGQDGSTRAAVPQLLERGERANVAIYAFGYGADHDAALLTHVAEQARTPFSFVEDSGDQAREAFAGAVGGLNSVVAQEVKLRLKCAVELKALHTPFSTERLSDSETVVTIADLFAGERKDVLVELAIFSDTTEDSGTLTLLEASASYTDLGRGCQARTPIAVMKIDVAGPGTQPEEEPDEEVCVQRERVEVKDALQRALEQGNHGNFTEAQQMLSAAESRMRPASSLVTTMLVQQLHEAREQLQSRAVFERQGRASISDSFQMHSVQRSTNSRRSMTQSMYLPAASATMCRRATTSG